MKLGLRITALMLVLLLIAGTCLSCASTSEPLNYLKEALENTLRERFGGELLSALSEATDGGMIALRFGGLHHSLQETPLEEAELQLWLNRSELTAAAAGSMTVNGTQYDGQLFFDRYALVASSDAFFGSTDLGIDFQTLSGDLKKSIFRNNSGTEYMIPWLGETAARDIAALKDGFFTVFGSMEEWYFLADEMADLFLEHLTDHFSGDWYYEDGRLHISALINNHSVSRALRAMYEDVVSDSDFCRALRKIAATRDAMESAKVGNGTKITDWTVRIENFLSTNVAINQWCAEVDNAPHPFELSLEAAIRSTSDVIETATVSLDVDRANVFSLGLDLRADETNVITFVKDGTLRTLCYTVTEDSLRYYNADLSYQKADAATGAQSLYVTGALRADRRTDAYSLALTKGVQVRVFEGTFDKMIDGYSFSVDTLTVNGGKYNCAFSLLIDVDADPDEAPADYKNFFNISHAEYRPIHRRAKTTLDKLKADWGETPVGPKAAWDRLLKLVGLDEEIG